MNLILEIAILGLLIYLFKTSVIALGKFQLPRFAEEMISLLPVAMLASLITSIVIDGAAKTEMTLYIVGATCVVLAGVITWIRKGISAACLVAMVLLLIVEYI
jgi:branched-subunit amino acid transport protein